MSSAKNTVAIPLTLHLSLQAKEQLASRAAASGTGLSEYVSAIVEQNAQSRFSLEELSGEVMQRFLHSGTTDEQLSDELEEAKHARRAERRAERAS